MATSRLVPLALAALMAAAFHAPPGALAAPHAQAPATPQSPQGSARPGVIAPRAQATPPRDPRARPTTGTGVISGRVLDQDGAPIPNARVRASLGGRRNTRTAITDSSGRYTLTALPATSFAVSANRTGYVARSTRASRSVTLTEGETRDNVDFVLVRGGVIVGRVFGPDGEPMVGVQVRAHQLRRSPSGSQLSPAGVPDTTDDLGAFRLHSLAPGQYFVVVRPSFSGAYAIDHDDEAEGVAPVFYPGTPDMASARRVQVMSGAETNADMSVPLARLFTVTGTVLDPEGRPMRSISVQLRSRTPEGDALSNHRMSVDGDGTFRLERGPVRAPRTMLAGETEVYVADHVQGVVVRLTRGATVRGRVTFATAPPTDLTEVRVMPRASGRSPMRMEPVRLAPDSTFELTGVRGPLTFAVVGGYVPSETATPLSGGTRGATPPVPGGMVGSALGSAPDGFLPPAGVRGRTMALAVSGNQDSASYVLPGGGGAWRVRAIRVGGRDVTDEGLNAGQEGVVSGVEIEVARDYPVLTGTVRDARGEPLASAQIVAIATDERTARQPEGPVRTVGSSGPDGGYVVTMLPPGTWELVAVPEDVPIDFFDDDPRTLELLRAHALRVTLAESQRTTLDLRALTQ